MMQAPTGSGSMKKIILVGILAGMAFSSTQAQRLRGQVYYQNSGLERAAGVEL